MIIKKHVKHGFIFMFNLMIAHYKLFLISFFSFFVLFIIRKSIIQKKKYIFLFHFFFFMYVIFLAIGGGGVQNDGYKRLNEFILLEENNQLEYAKNNLEKYDSILQIDLKQFKNSAEFKEYLITGDKNLDAAESICLGWIFIFIVELAWLFLALYRFLI